MNQQRQPKLTVVASQGYQTPGGFATRLQVRLLNHNNEENMRVSVNGRESLADSLGLDQEWGREVPLPGVGNHFVVVAIPALNLRERREINVPQPVTRVPYDIEIRTASPTPQGVTRVVVTVVDANERGVKGEFFVLRPSATTELVETSERGVAQLDLVTQEVTEEIEFVLAGTSRGNKRITIRGPRPRKPRYRGLTDEEARGTNPWRAFLDGLRSGRRR
mgnify:CR=1 FL=1